MNKTTTLLAASTLLLTATASPAAIIDGYSDVTINLDGTYTFVFDTMTPGSSPNQNANDDIINADGLRFSGFGLNLDVTGGLVIQDYPAHGGLGIDGGSADDNLGDGEQLNFSLGGTLFDVIDFTLNGGHSPSATGDFTYSSNKPGGSIAAVARFNDSADGITRHFSGGATGGDAFYTDGLTDFTILSRAINSSSYNNQAWSGYVESITIRVDRVPAPSVLALFALGIFALGLARRRVRS